jgi:hypothetical protein
MPNLKGANQKDYFAYMLRLWQECNNGVCPTIEGSLWRASLQSPHSNKRLMFASLDDLYHFLQIQVGLDPLANDDQNHE